MVKISVTNIKKVEAAFKKYGDEAVKELAEVTKIKAHEIENRAKSLAPVDDGTLRQNIRAEKQESLLEWRVTSYMPYSAFQEFGTGGLVNIPEGWESMASRFKGKGIKQINMSPQPFMYPAFVFGRATYEKDIEDSLKHLNNKFNNG